MTGLFQEDIALLRTVPGWNAKALTQKQATTQRLLHMSTTARALERARIKNQDGTFVDRSPEEAKAEPEERDKYRTFRDLFWRFDSLDEYESKTFMKEAVRICDDTLEEGWVVFATCSNANFKWLRNHFPPEAYVCDENGQGDEMLTLSPRLMFAETIRKMLIVGDHWQLQAFGHTINKQNTNLFRDFIKVLLFERKAHLHWPAAKLKEQRRMTTGFSWYSNTMCYNDELIDGPGTAYDERPLSQRFRTFLMEQYRIDSISCFLDVDGAEVKRSGTSRKNPSFALAAAAFLMRLFTYFTDPEELKPSQICIIITYAAQVKVYEDLFRELSKYPG